MNQIFENVGYLELGLLAVLLVGHVGSQWRSLRFSVLHMPGTGREFYRITHAFLLTFSSLTGYAFRAALVLVLMIEIRPFYSDAAEQLTGVFVGIPLVRWATDKACRHAFIHYSRNSQVPIRKFFLINLPNILGTLNVAAIILAVVLLYSVAFAPPLTRPVELTPKLQVVQNQVSNMSQTISNLENGIIEFSLAADSTLATVEELSETLLSIERNFEGLMAEKSTVENQIRELKLRTEEELKHDATYIVLHDLLSGGRFRGFAIAFVLGIVGSMIAGFFTTRLRLYRSNSKENPESGAPRDK